MGKQIVAFQAMFELAAASFPGAFAGYKLRVVESHQSSKKDTSGTAKAVVASLNDLGLQFDVADIEKVREPSQQVCACLCWLFATFQHKKKWCLRPRVHSTQECMPNQDTSSHTATSQEIPKDLRCAAA
jgi:hypothetical protein